LPASQQPFAIPRFDWPLARGTLSSGFGVRHGAMHEGVDIAAPVGTPVMAAASGRVIFAGRMRGYGKIIIIQHENHYVTVYAHDSTNLVREGQMVSRGQVIGRVGRTGHTTGANLHFEVRHNNVASNPLIYLAPIRTTSETRLAAGPSY
jgi:murein DD-endopeptidase MepM/ murein hydrolase activator NlpD